MSEIAGLLLVLGEAQVEPLSIGPISPASVATAERTRREPGIPAPSEFSGYAPREPIGPQFGLDPKRQVGTPIIEKARSRTRQVGWNELVVRTHRQPGLQ